MRIKRSISLTLTAISLTVTGFASSIGFTQSNLVSDIPGLAVNTDPHLQNPWGISSSATSPFWISDAGTGLSTLYNSAGVPQALVVTVPGGSPTGQVFNSTGKFNADLFIFASETGSISGWRGALGTLAEVLIDNTGAGAVYKGLAIGSINSDSYLYAADFHNNKIEVVPSAGAPGISGNFTDPNLPAGYAPFNIQNINGQLYIAYAKQDANAADEIAGAGFGYVSVFDLNGNFIRRFASQGNLNAPWGLAQAPAMWGSFGGDVLIGNFGDGTINAYDSQGNFVGTISDANGNPIVNDGLWALKFGNGGNGGKVNSLYFTAGLNNEANGLFGQLDPVPEPATFGLLALGGGVLAILRRKGLVIRGS